jgi:hypothetical protein
MELTGLMLTAGLPPIVSINARISESIVVISFSLQGFILHDQVLQVKKEPDFSLLAVIIKSFCGGPGGGFLEKSPLAAGGKYKSGG